MNLENVWYAYNAGGHCKRIVKNYPGGEQGLPDPADWFVTDLEHDLDQHLWLVRKFTCGRDSQTGAIEDAVFTMIRQLRYDSDRGRYLTRERSTDPAQFAKPIGDRWTEYLGDEPYRDFEVDVTGSPPNQTAMPVPMRRYIRGYGLIATEDENGGMQFIHGDLLGSTRLLTDEIGDAAARGEYLAFGQVVDLSDVVASGIAPTPGIRYGWCGSWGYQTDALEDLGASWGTSSVPTDGTATLADDESELGVLHIGARYYSPEIGRFVQRDPISVRGGINVYAYAFDCPGLLIDTSGKSPGLSVLGAAGIRIGASAAVSSAIAAAYVAAWGVAGAANWLAMSMPLPPGWTPDWTWEPPTGGKTTRGDPGEWRWFDPHGGEWRYHPPDRHHKQGHWDYNPWSTWNDEWLNVECSGQITLPLPGISWF